MVGRMTPWQVRNLYFCPRTKDGQVELPDEAERATLSADDVDRLRARAWKLSPAETERFVTERRAWRERRVKESHQLWRGKG